MPRWAGLLDAPVGGGPPASRPRRELRSAPRLEARPGPATAHGHRSLAPPLPVGVTGHRVLLQTSSIQGVFRVDFCPVVTNVVNSTAFSLKMLVFGLGLTTFVTGVLVRRFE